VALIPRVYIDTSVIGGCFDEGFREDSLHLLDEFRKGLLKAVLSDLTIGEMEGAPPVVRELLDKPPLRDAERVVLDSEADTLAEEYIREGVVTELHRVDAEHIAVATVCRADVLVSWNFRHIVNLTRIREFNAVNLRMGYPPLEIRSPREVLR